MLDHPLKNIGSVGRQDIFKYIFLCSEIQKKNERNWQKIPRSKKSLGSAERGKLVRVLETGTFYA